MVVNVSNKKGRIALIRWLHVVRICLSLPIPPPTPNPLTLFCIPMSEPIFLILTAPSRYPEDINAFYKDTFTIEVTWGWVLPGFENGRITGYKITLNIKGNPTRTNELEENTTQHQAEIRNLKPNTNYCIRVLAYTAKGDGPTSKAHFVRTGKGSVTVTLI